MRVARLVALRRLAPRRHRLLVAFAPSLAASVRVIDRIHYGASHGGADSEPAGPARLAQPLVHMLVVADGADGRHALAEYHPELARRQLENDIVALLGRNQGAGARGAGELSALAQRELDVVDGDADRNRLEGQGVARLYRGSRPGDDLLPDLEALGADDVALFPIDVIDEGDVRRAIRVVLYCDHDSGHSGFVALEVDVPVLLLVPATLMADRDAAVGSAPAVRFLAAGQRLLGRARVGGDLRIDHLHAVPDARRYRPECLYAHCAPPAFTRPRRWLSSLRARA